MTMQHDDPTADGAAVLRPGRVHPRRIDRANGRPALGRLQRQAIAAGHLAPRQGVRDQLVLTALGRAILERAATTGRPPHEERDRLLRDHAGDHGLRRALADGSPAAIAAALSRLRDDEAAALARLRAVLQP